MESLSDDYGSQLIPPAYVRVVAKAGTQHNVISVPQLLGLGIGRRQIAHWIAAGKLHRVHRGVFAVGRPDIAWHGRLMAAALAGGRGAAVSHRSAAALWRIRDQWRVEIDVITPIRGRHHIPGVAIHNVRRLDPLDLTIIDNIPVTTLPRTLLDLADVLDARALALIVHAADRRRVLDVRAVEALIERSPGRRLRKLRQAIDSPAPPERTEFVRRFLALLDSHGIRRPRLEYPIGAYIVDACWPDARLIVELDDYATHGTRRTFESDRERDAELQALGYRVVRITWRQLRDGAAPAVAVIRAATG